MPVLKKSLLSFSNKALHTREGLYYPKKDGLIQTLLTAKVISKTIHPHTYLLTKKAKRYLNKEQIEFVEQRWGF